MELDAVLTSIAEGLREERIRAGLTLEQLALRSDLSIAHLSRLESGDRQPSIAALITLSRALGISMSALLGEGNGGSALAVYDDDEPKHVANGLAVSACSLPRASLERIFGHTSPASRPTIVNTLCLLTDILRLCAHRSGITRRFGTKRNIAAITVLSFMISRTIPTS